MSAFDFTPGQIVTLKDGARVRVTYAGQIGGPQKKATVFGVTLNDPSRRTPYLDRMDEPDRWFYPEDVVA